MRQGRLDSNSDRVTASVAPVRPLRSIATAPAGRFAEQLQQRYQHHSIATDAEMELRRSTPALNFSSYHQHAEINVAPRLQLTVLQSTLPAAAQAAAAVAASLTRSSRSVLERQIDRSRQFQRIEQTERLVSQLQRDRTETLHQELVQRLVERTTRMETVAVSRLLAPVLTPPPPTMELATVQPVPQVVRRARVAAEVAAESIASEPARSIATSNLPAAAGFSQPAPPPIDVNRLTEQVMQTIDRRLLAYRERRGR